MPAGRTSEPGRRSRRTAALPGRRIHRTRAGSGGERWFVDEDLGAVGAVGVPSAGGVSLDAEAVVDLGVVAFAEQSGVLQAGLAAEDPLQQVVDVAPVMGGAAAGEYARLVPLDDRLAERLGHEALAASEVEGVAVGAEHDPGDVRVAGD